MSKLFSSKKGQEEIEMMVIPAFALVIVFGVIFFGLISIVDDIRNNSLFEKIFLARDTAILIDTLYVAPGSVEINYPKDTFWFSYHFVPGKVEVYDTTDEIEPRREKYFFADDVNIDFEEKEFKLGPDEFSYAEGLKRELKLRFVKDADTIFVKERGVLKDIPMKLYCPELESVESIEKQGLYTPQLVLSLPFEEERFKKAVKNAFVAIVPYVSSNDINTNNIIAYVSSSSSKIKESERMACLILNEMTSNEKLKEDISGVSIVFTDRFEDILNQGNIVVLLEIGNNIVKNEDAKKIVMESIHRGKEKYG